MLQGKRSWLFPNPPVIIGAGTVVGPEEGKGPLRKDFDLVTDDLRVEQSTWEKAERHFLEKAIKLSLNHAGLSKEQLTCYTGGDLLNQIISSTFAARTLGCPYLGLYGACATSMQALAISALLVSSGAANYVMTGTSSHNCTVEKQLRYPTEYGAQKPKTAQYTVTGAGTAIVAKEGKGPVVTAATLGKVVDLGIKDPLNMGTAMAPAAVDTIQAHFQDTGRSPNDYDLIVTGDLADVGLPIARNLLTRNGIMIDKTKLQDCGLMIYDNEKQSVFSGGSGSGCSAVVTYGHLVKQIQAKKIQRVLVVATGALLSPLTYQQGESIPCIAHAVAIETRR